MLGVKKNVRQLAVVGAAASVLASMAVSMTIGAGSAAAVPIGTATCTQAPVASRLEATCTNTDVGAATGSVFVLCTNLRTLNRSERMRPESTVELNVDCGPGAHPLTWNVAAETDYERSRELDRRMRDEDSDSRWNRSSRWR